MLDTTGLENFIPVRPDQAAHQPDIERGSIQLDRDPTSGEHFAYLKSVTGDLHKDIGDKSLDAMSGMPDAYTNTSPESIYSDATGVSQELFGMRMTELQRG